MAQSRKQASKQQNKLTRQQKLDRAKAASEKERRAQERALAAGRTKKIFAVIVCVILVIALGIPAIALTVLSSM